jgi:AcrR family transcriptional regulator
VSKRPTDKNPVREPIQDRAIRTKENIIEAGKLLFSEKSYHNVMADDIAREAGVSVGSFYAYFKDKRHLFMTIIDRYMAEITSEARESLKVFSSPGEISLKNTVRKIVEVMVASHKRSPLFLKESLRMSLYDEDIETVMKDKIDSQVKDLISEVLLSSEVFDSKEKTKTMAYVIYYASEGVIHELVLGHDEIDEEEVIEELSRLFTCYINDYLNEVKI